MKTTQPITPEQAGLSLSVIAGPTGALREDWPCISYRVAIHDSRRREVWSGDYHLGTGHVKFRGKRPVNLSLTEASIAEHLALGKTIRPEYRKEQAETAAKFAKVQGVTPKLNDVAHSILSDGAAFFDGQRFEDWAADFGYDPDSRKAEAVFKACDDTGRQLARAFSRDTLDGLREWASNY
jgi:hypothetical protein